MKRISFIITFLLLNVISIMAHPIDYYKFIVISHQEDAAADIEPRMIKEFSDLGFIVISDEEASELRDQTKHEILYAKYRCRQSGECIFKLELINNSGNTVYEDEQIFGAEFMSRKNDRQGAIKRIFRELKKLNYQYTPIN